MEQLFGRVAQQMQTRRFQRAASVVGETMASRRLFRSDSSIATMHGWTAKHYVISAIIILLAVGMFAYSWS
jgi:hypothetical protein